MRKQAQGVRVYDTDPLPPSSCHPMNRRAAPHRGIDAHYGDTADDRPSKTQLKQASHELQRLGLALAELSPQRFASLELPEALREAIEAYRRTRSHEGRRRQLQFVGKLMRGVDPEPLREAVAEAELGSARETLLLHDTERWRQELLADDQAATRWVAAHPECDAQQLRSLVRAARRDALSLGPDQRQPRSMRELFQFLKPHLQAR